MATESMDYDQHKPRTKHAHDPHTKMIDGHNSSDAHGHDDHGHDSKENKEEHGHDDHGHEGHSH